MSTGYEAVKKVRFLNELRDSISKTCVKYKYDIKAKLVLDIESCEYKVHIVEIKQDAREK